MADESALRQLPSVDHLVSALTAPDLPRAVVVEMARSAIDQARSEILAGRVADAETMAHDLLHGVEQSRLHPVINATGVLLHTNLGRAPISARAADAAHRAASAYTNLEMDLGSGERGGRGAYLRLLLRTLTGAEDALVVNNNAAAVLLALAGTAEGLGVPVARGELIEIGGSYRLPLVMEAGGARLIEVGTTNRTRVGDFVTALQLHRCGAVLRVHPSNYRVEGFVEEAPLRDLVEAAHDAGLPLIHDIGSGLLDAEAPWLGPSRPEWLAGEPGARQSIDAGADLVMFSGDKLLGGPQAGIIVGKAEHVDRLRRHPLARALRIDAMTAAALAATLESFARNDVVEIPFWSMASLTESDLEPRVDRLARRLQATVRRGSSVIGAGSVPGTGIPTPQVRLEGEDHLFSRLLAVDHPVLTRRVDKDLVIDLRAVGEDEDDTIADMVAVCR